MSEIFILFTMASCTNCHHLKRQIQQEISQGLIREYDLNAISSNKQLMSIFSQISPQKYAPALAIMQNGQIIDSAVGTTQILELLDQ